MDLNQFINLAKKRGKTIFSLMALFLVVGLLVTVAQPFEYGAKSKLLLVQSNVAGVDPYVISKSNGYLSDVLANVVSSNSFFSDVMNSGYHIDQGYFSGREDKIMEKWAETVDAKAINDTGIILINVYHPDRYQADQIAEAVNYILKTKNNQYHGADDVSIKVIDQPIVSSWPVKPNIFLNLGLALALGLVFSLSFIYLFPKSEFSFKRPKFFPRFQGRKVKALEPAAMPAPVLAEADEDISDEASAPENLPLEEDGDSPLTYDDIIRQGDIKNIL